MRCYSTLFFSASESQALKIKHAFTLCFFFLDDYNLCSKDNGYCSSLANYTMCRLQPNSTEGPCHCKSGFLLKTNGFSGATCLSKSNNKFIIINWVYDEGCMVKLAVVVGRVARSACRKTFGPGETQTHDHITYSLTITSNLLLFFCWYRKINA